MSGNNTIESMVAQLRSLGKLLPGSAAEINAAMLQDVKSKVAAGTDQDGNAWSLTAQGQPALQRAAADIEGQVVHTARQTISIVRIKKKHLVLHDAGRANGAPRRQILPDKITPSIKRAITGILTNNFQEATRG